MYPRIKVMKQTGIRIVNSTQLQLKTSFDYYECCWANAFCCDHVFDQMEFEVTIIEGFQDSIHQSMRLFGPESSFQQCSS